MPDPKRVSLSIPRDTRYLSLVRRAVVVLASRVGFAPAATGEIEMAVDEAASNAIRHARGEGAIGVEALWDGGGLTITIHDVRFTSAPGPSDTLPRTSHRSRRPPAPL